MIENTISAEVVIVGAGPAGSVTGINLIKNNIDCILVDKELFPRNKLCGGLITTKGMEALQNIEIDIEDDVFFRPEVIRFYLSNKKIFEYCSGSQYGVVKRLEFDKILVNKYLQLGGKLFMKCRVVDIDVDNKIVYSSDGKKISYKYLVGADGANSIVRRHINDKKICMGTCIENSISKDSLDKELKNMPADGINVIFHKGLTGFNWIFENRDDLVIGGGGINISIEELCNKIKLFFKTKLKQGAMVPYGELPSIRAKKDVFLIGDAAGYVDPIFGEGLSHAILAGQKIMEIIKDNLGIRGYKRKFKKECNMVKYGALTQKILFSKFGMSIFIKTVKNHPNLTARLCEQCVIKQDINYYDIPKVITEILLKKEK